MTRLVYVLLFVLSFLYAGSVTAKTADSYSLTTSSITGTSALLSWSGSGTATSFDIRWRKVGGSQWITTSAIRANEFLLTDLEAGQAYEWQLLPVGSAIWLGSPATFTTIYTCYAPYTYSPSSISATAVQLSWGTSGPTSATTVFTVEFRPIGVTSWSSTAFSTPYNNTLGNLIPGTTYEWRVREACSTFSTIATFTTPACSVVNAGVAPQATSAQFRFDQTAGIAYSLLWRPQGGNWTTVSNQTNSYPPQFQLTGLTSNAVYEYQIQPVCGAVKGTPTPPALFTAVCAAPTSVSLLTAGSNNATVSWRSTYKGSYDFSYSLQYRPKTSPVSSWSVASSYYNTSYTPQYDFYASVSGLTPQSQYDLRVLTTCPNSASSAFSDPPISFSTTSCVGAVTNFYASSQSVNSVYVNWSGSSDSYYATQFRVSGATSWSQVGPSTYVGSTGTTLQNLQTGTEYQWRVATYCSLAEAPQFTSIQTFTTIVCSPSRLYNVNAQPDYNGATLNWSEQYPGTNLYVVQYRLAGVGSYTALAPQTGFSANLTGLANNTAYEWQVAPVCDANATSYSFTAPQTFTTTCRQVAGSLYSSGNQGTTRQVSWSTSSTNYNFTNTYTIRYRPQGSDWLSQTFVSGSSNPTISLSALAPNVTYDWEVARQCTAGLSSTFTAGPAFSTACRNTIYSLTTSYITATRATLGFASSDYNITYQLRYRLTGAPTWTVVTLTNTQPISLWD